MRPTCPDARPAGRAPAAPILLTAMAIVATTGCAAGRAPGPMVTDRPDFTESASTVAPGHAQLEAGYTRTGTASATRHDIGEMLVRVGVSEGAEIRVGIGSWGRIDPEVGQTTSGLVGSSLGVKLRLPSTTLVPDAAVLVGTTVPVSDALGDPGWTPSVLLAGAWTTPVADLGANVGYSHAETGSGTGEVLASVAAGFPIMETVGGFLELYGLKPLGAQARTFVDAGLTWGIGADLQLDVRVARSTAAPAETTFGVGLALRR